MAITTDSVLTILGPEHSSVDAAAIAEFVSAAELVVAEDLAQADLSVERKELITKYLAAHFAIVSLERGGLKQQKIGDSADTYKTGMDSDQGYLLTRFGQQAVSLDTSGALALNAAPRIKAEFRVVTPPSSKDYGDDISPN